LRQQSHHEIIEVKILGQQSKSLGATRARITLGCVLLFVHLANDVSTNLFPASQRLLQRRAQLESGNFTHLLEHFVCCRGELSILFGTSRGGRGGTRRILPMDPDTAKKKQPYNASGQS